MTTDKAFKRVVRARMAKTGERYAAARRTLVEGAPDGHHSEPTAAATPSGYRMRGGLHPETATLANVLANQGVVSGLTGEPLTEAAILGIGGGLGAAYILWEFKSHGGPVLTLGFRNQPQYPSIPGWTGKTLDRLGVEPDLHETGGAKGAREALDAPDAGVPVTPWSTSSRRDRGQPKHCRGIRFRLRSSDSTIWLYLVATVRDPSGSPGRNGLFRGGRPSRPIVGSDRRPDRSRQNCFVAIARPGGPGDHFDPHPTPSRSRLRKWAVCYRRAEREGVAAGLRRRPRPVRLAVGPPRKRRRPGRAIGRALAGAVCRITR